MFIVPSLGCFVSLGVSPSAHYAQQPPSGPGLHLPSQQGHSRPWCMRQPGAARTAYTYLLSTVSTHY